jgi:hypothetical protein
MATAQVYWSREAGGASGVAHGMPFDHGTRSTVISRGQSSRSIILSEEAMLSEEVFRNRYLGLGFE